MTAKINNGKINCILISGKAHSGKDTVADLLALYLPEFGLDSVQTSHLAVGIKSMATTFCGWDGVKDAKGRKLLQDFGEAFRSYDVDVWTKHMLTQVESRVFLPNVLLVPDWRYEAERDFIMGLPLYNVISVRVENSSSPTLEGDAATHISEHGLRPVVGSDLSGYIYDYLIVNDSRDDSFDTLLESVFNLIDGLVVDL